MAYKVTAYWQEIRELEFESLDEAAAWAEKLLDEEPQASIQVAGERFHGGWFTPTPYSKAVARATGTRGRSPSMSP